MWRKQRWAFLLGRVVGDDSDQGSSIARSPSCFRPSQVRSLYAHYILCRVIPCTWEFRVLPVFQCSLFLSFRIKNRYKFLTNSILQRVRSPDICKNIFFQILSSDSLDRWSKVLTILQYFLHVYIKVKKGRILNWFILREPNLHYAYSLKGASMI